jgi:nitroreductase
VLHHYFSAVAAHPTIERAKAQVESVTFPEHLSYESERGCQALLPYLRDLSAAPTVGYPELYELAKRRRSVRWYRQETVPRELIDRAVLVAAQSPTACNRQPFQFRIYDEPEIVQKIVALPTGTPGYRENIPVVVVVVGQLSAYFDERDRHGIYIDASLAAMSFVLALESHGLSSCCINWPEIPALETRMATLLGLEPHERVVMLISVGYPDPTGMVAYSHKKSLSLLRSYNQR